MQAFPTGASPRGALVEVVGQVIFGPLSQQTLEAPAILSGSTSASFCAVRPRTIMVADDPLLFETSILGEYERCRTRLGLSDLHLADVARGSLLASSAPRELVDRSLTTIDDWLATAASRQVVYEKDRRVILAA